MSDPFFDTNILVDWLKDRPQAIGELSRYNRHRISRIVWTEILAGEPMETRDQVQQLIAPFDVVEVDSRIAAAAAGLHFRSRMKLLDAMIEHPVLVERPFVVTPKGARLARPKEKVAEIL